MEPRVLREQVVEHKVVVPKRVQIEETYERTVIVPEVRMREEIVEDTVVVKERIVEVEKLYTVEKVVPRVEYVDKIVEIPQTVIKEIPKYVDVEIEKITEVEVPELVVKEVEVEKIVDVEIVKEVIVPKQVIKPKYVEFQSPVVKEVIVNEEIRRVVPQPYRETVTQTYEIPQITHHVETVPVPVFAPRFIEVPIPAEQMTQETLNMVESIRGDLQHLISKQTPLGIDQLNKLADDVPAPGEIQDGNNAVLASLSDNSNAYHNICP